MSDGEHKAQPIYKLWLMKNTEAWYQLSDEERQAIGRKLEQAIEQVGGKLVLGCYSGWASEQWQAFGVEEYPNIEAVQQLTALHHEMNWFRYIDSMTLLGTKWEEPA